MIVLEIAAEHILNIEQANIRDIYNMVKNAITNACEKTREKGAKPISMVDDLSMHSLGPWIETFGKCLAYCAKRENISVVGGEMAQMRDVYRKGYVGVVVTVVGVRV